MKARADKSEKSRCLIYLVCSNKQLHRGGHQSVDVAMRYQRPLRERDSALTEAMQAMLLEEGKTAND